MCFLKLGGNRSEGSTGGTKCLCTIGSFRIAICYEYTD